MSSLSAGMEQVSGDQRLIRCRHMEPELSTMSEWDAAWAAGSPCLQFKGPLWAGDSPRGVNKLDGIESYVPPSGCHGDKEGKGAREARPEPL